MLQDSSSRDSPTEQDGILHSWIRTPANVSMALAPEPSLSLCSFISSSTVRGLYLEVGLALSFGFAFTSRGLSFPDGLSTSLGASAFFGGLCFFLELPQPVGFPFFLFPGRETPLSSLSVHYVVACIAPPFFSTSLLPRAGERGGRAAFS